MPSGYPDLLVSLHHLRYRQLGVVLALFLPENLNRATARIFIFVACYHVIDMIKALILGFFVNMVTGLDDTITKTPILSSITRTRAGKLAFACGNLFAVLIAILFAASLSRVLDAREIFRYVAAGIIFVLAFIIYYDVFKARGQFETRSTPLLRYRISTERFLKLIGVGFIVSLLTVLDDAVAFIPLFSHDVVTNLMAATGILLATILQLALMIFSAGVLQKFKYSRAVAFYGLLLYGLLILIGIA